MNRQLAVAVLALSFLAACAGDRLRAQTPNPVTPGYQICRTTDPGNTQCSFQPTDLTHGLPVNLVAGSVSASLAPFTPAAAGARGTPLVVSTVDVTGTIPTNTGAVVLSNPGATVAYCNLNNVAATTADFPIAPGGGAVAFGVPAAITVFRCISTGAGTTINSVGGAGLGAFTGGGGGSGGGGGAVTIADGVDIAEGAKADAVCATPSSVTPCSMIALAKAINNNVSSPIPTGANLIGDVNLRQGGTALSTSNPSFFRQTDGTTAQVTDPCQGSAKVYTPINVVTATNTIITGVAAKKKYVCGIFLYPAGTQNVAIFQATTGTACATALVAVIGGTTTATGIIMTAQAGFVLGNGISAVAATTVNQTDLCIVTSASVQLSGVVVTVDQ